MLHLAATIVYALVTFGLFLGDALPSTQSSFATILCGLFAAVVACAFGYRTTKAIEDNCRSVFPWLIGLLAIAQFNLFVLRGVGELLSQRYLPGTLLALLGLLPLLHFIVPQARRFAFWSTIGLFVWLFAATLSDQPNTPFVHLQQSSTALLNRSNPYEEIYAATSTHASSNGTNLELNPLRQLPATVFAVVPSYFLMGDVRWAMLIALIGSVLLLRSIVERRDETDSKQRSMVSWLPLMILYHPQTLVILREGHPEPFFALAIIATCWAILKGNVLGKIVGLAGILSTSPLGVLSLPSILLLGRIRFRQCGLAIVFACLPLIPFCIWNCSELRVAISGGLPDEFAVLVSLGLSTLLAISLKRKTTQANRITSICLCLACALLTLQLCRWMVDLSGCWVVCAIVLIPMLGELNLPPSRESN